MTPSANLRYFVLDDDSPRELLFFAFDTGFAPVESLIEHAINLDLEVPVRLVRVVPGQGLPYRPSYCRRRTHDGNAPAGGSLYGYAPPMCDFHCEMKWGDRQ